MYSKLCFTYCSVVLDTMNVIQINLLYSQYACSFPAILHHKSEETAEIQTKKSSKDPPLGVAKKSKTATPSKHFCA